MYGDPGKAIVYGGMVTQSQFGQFF